MVGAVGLDIEKGRKVKGCGERCFFRCFFFAQVTFRCKNLRLMKLNLKMRRYK